MLACDDYEANLKSCTCTYDPCERKGYCCKCIAYHKRYGELVGCLFPPAGEKTYDRSIENFLKWQRK
ncbi:MAG: DUF6485 family protein [Actinobacteria bacterium]|nr:DUF6485 family protein [Actinomycetota bacterium]